MGGKIQIFFFVNNIKSNYSKKQYFLSSFLLTWDNIPVQNGHGVLSRLVLWILGMELACSVLNGHFEPVYLLQVSKNDKEEHRLFLGLAVLVILVILIIIASVAGSFLYSPWLYLIYEKNNNNWLLTLKILWLLL